MAEEKEQQKMLMEDVTVVVDFDVLCSTVAQKGKWVNLNENVGEEEEENLLSEYQQKYGDGVFRMWEGELVYDCFDDRRIAIQSACCPCYRFGKNMKRAGQGSCFFQASIHFILIILALFNLSAFLMTKRRCFLYLAIASTVSIGTYAGFYRMQIRKKFNIKGSDSSVDDCVYHLICPCCTLSQESRTLEMNNVQDGIWHGRGDTICVGSFSKDMKGLSELSPPIIVSTKSPELLSMQKNHKWEHSCIDLCPPHNGLHAPASTRWFDPLPFWVGMSCMTMKSTFTNFGLNWMVIFCSGYQISYPPP